jgi:hypothetical protein
MERWIFNNSTVANMYTTTYSCSYCIGSETHDVFFSIQIAKADIKDYFMKYIVNIVL